MISSSLIAESVSPLRSSLGSVKTTLIGAAPCRDRRTAITPQSRRLPSGDGSTTCRTTVIAGDGAGILRSKVRKRWSLIFGIAIFQCGNPLVQLDRFGRVDELVQHGRDSLRFLWADRTSSDAFGEPG